MAALRIAFAALLAAVAGAFGSWLALGVFGVVTDIHRGGLLLLDPVEMARSLAISVVINVPIALPLTAGAAVIALRLERRLHHRARADAEGNAMRTRFLLGCAAAGAVWESAAMTMVAGAMRVKPTRLGPAFGLAAGAAGGLVLWQWSQRVTRGGDDAKVRRSIA